MPLRWSASTAVASDFLGDVSGHIVSNVSGETLELSPAVVRPLHARRQAVSFLFDESSSYSLHDSLPIIGEAIDDHHKTSFHGHGEEESAAGEGAKLASDPALLMDPYEWVKIASAVATVGNFVALGLTFIAAAYHAYGYIQYKRAVEQQANGPAGHGHGHGHGGGGHH
mmetsp:Transcript_7145/g.11588  ORF Transcript_7145/g.11588 Transcript_7145/m.11588 type:complete len:169 (+) Transcript_7145:30-536(+)